MDDWDLPNDKQWAAKYLLGPLYDPEPSQVFATRFKPLPSTPPDSVNPPRRRLSQRSRRSQSEDADADEKQPFLTRLLSRSNTVNSKPSLNNKPLPRPPPSPRSKYPPLSGLDRKRSVHTANPPQTRWNQGTVLFRANSLSTPRPSSAAMATAVNQAGSRRRAGSLAERYPDESSRRTPDMLNQEHRARDRADTLPRRSASLRERYPGDMSHRPLEMLKRDHRAADRAPHLHNHRRQQPNDPIDSLDVTGPVPGVTYHHEGPFDPTMKERNNKPLAPVEAVMDTNLEALKATPLEYLKDSLIKHVPLQGTAVVPPGMRDLGGRVMDYQEGPDLMRESDAPGGPYKRWEQLRYRDDDLKGKGEPAFSDDQRRRARGKQRASASPQNGTVYYEMQTPLRFTPTRAVSGSGKQKQGGNTYVRQRSASSGAELLPQAYAHEDSASSGLQRSRSSAGESLAQTLKRRFGSLRRKKVAKEAGY